MKKAVGHLIPFMEKEKREMIESMMEGKGETIEEKVNIFLSKHSPSCFYLYHLVFSSSGLLCGHCCYSNCEG
jgi:hypothetical protein